MPIKKRTPQQKDIQEDPNPRVRIHIAHINLDVAMGDPLKKTPSTQLFTVFGLPRTQLEATADGEYTIKMEGVDIYNPVDNTVSSAGADKLGKSGAVPNRTYRVWRHIELPKYFIKLH